MRFEISNALSVLGLIAFVFFSFEATVSAQRWDSKIRLANLQLDSPEPAQFGDNILAPDAGTNGQSSQDEDGDPDCPKLEEVLAKFKPISELTASISQGDVPKPVDCSKGIFTGKQTAIARTPSVLQYHWKPTNFFHNPLYFDDTPLERYGQSVCPPLQPAISGARFFATLPVLPYKVGLDRPFDCVSTLGYYRPGECAPCMRERFPAWERDAALLEAGTALALIFALP